MFYLKTNSYIGFTFFQKERKQDYTHVDHNQLDIRYHLKSYTPILWICGSTGTR